MTGKIEVFIQCEFVEEESDGASYVFKGTDGVLLKVEKIHFFNENREAQSVIYPLEDPAANTTYLYNMSCLPRSLPPNLPSVPKEGEKENEKMELEENPKFRWQDAETKQLISLYQKYKGVIRKKTTMWRKIAEDLCKEFKISVDDNMVKNRWFTINKLYKEAKDNNRKTGWGPKRARFEKELDDVLIGQKDINPIALSTSGTLQPNETRLQSTPEPVGRGLQSTPQPSGNGLQSTPRPSGSGLQSTPRPSDDYNNESLQDDPLTQESPSDVKVVKQLRRERKKHVSPTTLVLQELVQKVDKMTVNAEERNLVLKVAQEDYCKDLIHAQRYRRELSYKLKLKAMGMGKENRKRKPSEIPINFDDDDSTPHTSEDEF